MDDGTRFAVTDEEIQASYRLRYSVYVESMGRLKEKGDHERRELRDEYDDVARAVVTIKEGKPVGTLRLFWGGDECFSRALLEAYHLEAFNAILGEDQICIVERMMVAKQHRGTSVALRLYKEVMHFVLAHNIELVLLDCEPHHLNSYLKLGFRPFTYPYTYPYIGLVIPMALITGDYEHLKRVASPFAMLLSSEDLDHCQHVEQLQQVIQDGDAVLTRHNDSNGSFLECIYALRKGVKGAAFDTRPTVFDSLTDEEINRLVDKSNMITCQKGDHIIEKDNSARTLFILLSGVAQVQRDGVDVAVLTPGEVFGEIAFFLDVPRSASIIAASEELKILSLDDHSLSRLLKQDGELANKVLMNICQGLCHRIVATTDDFRGDT